MKRCILQPSLPSFMPLRLIIELKDNLALSVLYSTAFWRCTFKEPSWQYFVTARSLGSCSHHHHAYLSCPVAGSSLCVTNALCFVVVFGCLHAAACELPPPPVLSCMCMHLLAWRLTAGFKCNAFIGVVYRHGLQGELVWHLCLRYWHGPAGLRSTCCSGSESSYAAQNVARRTICQQSSSVVLVLYSETRTRTVTG